MKGLLVVIPRRARGAEPVAPGVVLAGLPLLRRIVLGAERAGLQPVVVGYARSEVEPLLVGTSAVVVGPDAPPPAMPDGRIVLLPVSVIPQPEWLRGILEMPLEHERLYVDRAGAAVLETADVGAVIAAAASRCGTLDEVVAAICPALGKVELPFDAGGRFVLAGPGQLPAAERWLLRGLIKPTEGFMSRHFERRVSLALTRRLCTTPITPNAMTLVSVAIGLAGAPFFLSASPGLQLTGALLFLLHSILDGCDGELARLKFLESRSGAMLDAIGDNLVHEAVFLCMTIGWMLASGSRWPLLFGCLAIASTLCVALVVHGRGMRASIDGGPRSAVSRVADVMVYRDFIYVIVMLAAVGKAWWFLVITAIGGPMFLLLLAWLGRKR